MKYCANILEILLIVALFFLFGCYAVPDVNEAHYLEKAAHFWNPEYAAGDFFLNSLDAHGVFYWTFGWLTLFLPLSSVIWVGRFLTWIGLACGWFWMTRPILKAWGLSLLSAGLFLFLCQNCSFAGEWVVGGLEAKGFAYILAFFALGEVLRNHWNRSLVLFGLSAMFHVLVGGWCLVALGLAWLILKDYERGLRKSGKPGEAEKCYLPTFREILPGLILAFLFTLPALVPALQLNRGVEPEVAKNATQLYVCERLPHHLLLSFIAQKTPQKLVMFGVLIVVWNFLCARPRYTNGEMTFRTFIYGTLFIAMIGWGINLLMNALPELSTSLLRYYWFRVADVMVPLGVAVVCVEFATCWTTEALLGTENSEKSEHIINYGRKRTKEERRAERREQRVLEKMMRRRRKMLLVFLIMLACLPIYQSAQRFMKPMKPRSCSGASCGESWLDLCRYVRENTEEDALFMVPYTVRTFRWYTGRSQVGVWKDIPQDSQGLMDWWDRMQDQFYGFDPSNPVQTYGRVASFTLLPKGKLDYVQKKYQIDYLVRNKNDLKGRQILTEVPNGIEDYELIYENKDFELRKMH